MRQKNHGLTIVEVLIACVIGTVLMGIVLSMWYFAYKNWTIERVRTKLRINLEIAMEKMKEETRLSSNTYMSLYKPAGETDYTAISFPQATVESSGLLTLEDDDIYWDKSVIYHVYDNTTTGNTEFRRTQFDNNNSILTDKAKREQQLADVVAGGNGSGTYNNANASTSVIFENLADLTIKPQSQLFDGYSATVKRSDNVGFGSIKLEPGYHDFKFEVADKNPASSGYKFGIDTLSISPSGCLREAEALTPLATSGNGYSKIYAVGWNGNNYLEFSSDAVTDYMTFRLYYDMWTESNFDNSVRDNTVLTGSDLYVKLATPKENGKTVWQASSQTGSDSQDYPAEGETLILPADVSIRNILSKDNLQENGELVRTRFIAHSASSFVISEAWLEERSAGDDGIGAPMQLFFSDAPIPLGELEPDTGGNTIGGTVGVTPTGITIPAGYYVWSNWAIFSIDKTKDYFVTFRTPAANTVYWKPENPAAVNSYYSEDDAASSSVWVSSSTSPSIYASDEAWNWVSTGSVTSTIYDTKLTSPSYNTITWSEYEPSGTSITVKGRASSDPNMAGASSWDSIPSSSIAGSGRYVQFRAEFDTEPPYTGYPWIDNVSIDWPGEAKICDISGYFTQKPDYGIIKLTVDGQELTKGLEFSLTVYEDVQGKTYDESLTVEMEPRNTGK